MAHFFSQNNQYLKALEVTGAFGDILGHDFEKPVLTDSTGNVPVDSGYCTFLGEIGKTRYKMDIGTLQPHSRKNFDVNSSS